MEYCSRCGSATGLGEDGDEVRMMEPSIRGDLLADWVHHVMTQSLAVRGAVKSPKPGSVWVLWFMTQHGCYHWEPGTQGWIAISRKFYRSEIVLEGIENTVIDDGIAELVSSGVIELAKNYGDEEESRIEFSHDFLNIEVKAFLRKRRILATED